jgi:hypothetical protein
MISSSSAGPPRSDGFQVALKGSLKRLLVLPFGVLRCQRLHPIEGEGQLNVHRFFSPQCAVVVKGGNALLRGHKVGIAWLSHPVYKVDNGSFNSTLIPGRKRISSFDRVCRSSHGNQKKYKESHPSKNIKISHILLLSQSFRLTSRRRSNSLLIKQMVSVLYILPPGIWGLNLSPAQFIRDNQRKGHAR